MKNDTTITTLTFTDTKIFHQWLKKQSKTRFSVPVHVHGTQRLFTIISVTKRALDRMMIEDTEALKVEISNAPYGRKKHAFIEPIRRSALEVS
jgi:hypothetical protein